MKSSFQLGAMYWQNPNHSFKEVEEDMRRIKGNNFSIIRAFIWWEQLERKKGHYDFAMHDRLFEAAAKHGIKIMETFGLYLPFWLTRELLAKGIEDKDRYWCFDRPEIYEPMGRFIDAVVSRYGKADAMGLWNLWNEPTKNHCHCAHTQAKFIAWLKGKYKTIEVLKKAWLGEFQVFTTFCPDSWEELDNAWLNAAFRPGERGRSTPADYDYLEFATVNLDENLAWIRDRVKAIDPIHPTHANPCVPLNNELAWGGFDGWRMAHTLDTISMSIHPAHMFFSVSKNPADFPLLYAYSVDKARSWAEPCGKDAWVGELQAGATVNHPFPYCPSDKEITHYLWTAFARGMKGLLFWEWQSWRSSMMEVGEFSLREAATGAPTERSEAASEVGRLMKENAEIFAEVRRQPSQVAIMASRDSNNFRALEGVHKSWVQDINLTHAYATFGCHRALNMANIATDLVNEEEIENGALKSYKALFLPHVEVMRASVAARIEEFVKEGGHVWADGRCAYLDEHIYLREAPVPGHGLSEVFGCREADITAPCVDFDLTLSDGSTLKGMRHQQYLKPTSGSTIAKFPNGQPAIVRNNYGKGVAELVGTYLTLSLRENPDAQSMKHIAAFALAAGAKPTLEINLGFEALLLESKDIDVMVVCSRPGTSGEAVIKTPRKYSSVESPMGGVSFDGKSIKRKFADFETALFICKK